MLRHTVYGNIDDRFDLVEEKEARLKEDLEIFSQGNWNYWVINRKGIVL